MYIKIQSIITYVNYFLWNTKNSAYTFQSFHSVNNNNLTTILTYNSAFSKCYFGFYSYDYTQNYAGTKTVF